MLIYLNLCTDCFLETSLQLLEQAQLAILNHPDALQVMQAKYALELVIKYHAKYGLNIFCNFK